MLIGIIGIIVTAFFAWYFWKKRPPHAKGQEKEIAEIKVGINRIIEEVKDIKNYLDGWQKLPLTDEKRITFDKGLKAMKECNWNSAIDTFRGLLSDAKDNKKVALLNLIGNCFFHQGNLDQALGHYKESLDLAREINDKEGEATNLGNIGLIYQARGELEKALKYHEEALRVSKEIGYKEGEAANLGNIGLIYQTRGELDKALKYHEEALKIYREMGNKEGEAQDLGNIGLIYAKKGDKEKALFYFNRALEIFKQIGAQREIVIIENNIRKLQEEK